VTDLLLEYGPLLLFAAVAIESAGIPLPGETALVTAGVLAASGRLHHSIVLVIAAAAAGAVVGDNVGYWVGRRGGRRLLERWPPVARHAARVLPPAERFFARHGAKTVFVGRFVAVLRVTAAWLAGVGRMPWWRFLAWNAAGGVCWATLVGVVAYYGGAAAAEAIARYGLYALAGIVVALAAGGLGVHLWRRRVAESV
jgi:membrane protein DedA with SNARE-associated domain